jgi:hypothetical protein
MVGRTDGSRFGIKVLAGALVVLAGLASVAEAQTRRSTPGGWQGHRGTRVQSGGNDYVGAGRIGPAPGALARPAFSGIGSSSRSNIDLLSSPAASRTFATPLPVFNVPDRHHHHDHGDHWKWRRHHGHRHDRHHRYYDPFRPSYFYGNDYVVTVGTGLSVGGYGYSNYQYPGYAYPSSTVGVMPLPAPAVAYDPVTRTYVYAYANPNAAPLASGTPVMPAPAPAAAPNANAPTPPTPTALEIAAYNLRDGMNERAISELREHLKAHDDDAKAQRVLGVALLSERRLDDGVASIRQAYRIDPGLADEPIDGYELGLDVDELRNMVLRAVTHANRADTGSAWLTVTALMQAEGRKDAARNMLERARAKGVEPEIVGAMKAALKT